MPRREVTPQPIDGDPRSVLFVTDVAHLPSGQVTTASGTVGPLLEYRVLSALHIVDEGVLATLASPHSWADHGPRIRDAVRLAVDLEGWDVAPDTTDDAAPQQPRT